jgi:excisionase family DNA binding protein
VSPQEAAEQLGICRETVYRLCASGRLPYLRVGSALRLVLADIVAALAKSSD